MSVRAGIYGRNSKGEAKSIEDQLELGRDAVAENGWTLTQEYQDDSSASLYRHKERENWSRLLADLAAGALDVLVLWKPARGSRDEIDWFPLLRSCQERGVLLHIVADGRTYDPRDGRDWKTLADEGVNASYYSRQLSKDVRRGVGKAASKGGPHGRVAFGYDGRYDETTKRPVRVPNAHAVIVREIFERLDQLTPISTLTKDFRDRDVPSPSGKPWQRNTIRTIATNVSYVGLRRHDGEDHAAQWLALVEEGTFWRVQELLSQPERKTTRPGSAKYLLSYIATAPCGGHLRRINGKAGGAERYSCVEDGCVSIVQAEADEVVESIILARLARPDARALFARDGRQEREAHAEAARYRVQLEEARQSFELPDGISAEALARKERALLPLIEDAERRARPVGTSGALGELLDAEGMEAVQAVWDGWGMAARRSVVSAVARVVLGPPTRRLPKHADPELRLTEAFARLTVTPASQQVH